MLVAPFAVPLGDLVAQPIQTFLMLFMLFRLNFHCIGPFRDHLVFLNFKQFGASAHQSKAAMVQTAIAGLSRIKLVWPL